MYEHGGNMARFLRDELITNVSLTETDIEEIFANFLRIQEAHNASLLHPLVIDQVAETTYIIRFDGKGYRVDNKAELLAHFRQAKKVERIVLIVETVEALQSNRTRGRSIDLRIDTDTPQNSYLTVTADEQEWTTAQFTTFHELLEKNKNHHHWVRSGLTYFSIQLIAVIACILLSVWAAGKLAPRLAIESPFVFGFIFTFLLLSNLWTFLATIVKKNMEDAFPSIKFVRPSPKGPQWLLQWLLLAILAYVLSQFGGFFLDILANMVNKSA
jgi:hypothetical protein